MYGYWPAQMWIYKLLTLLDFRILAKTGRPCLGLDYYAMQNGPVLSYLYYSRENGCMSSAYCFVPAFGYDRYDIKALKEPDLSYFSDRAVEEMRRLSDEFISSRCSLNELIAATHQLPAWRKAWDDAQKCGRGRMIMEYRHSFPEDPELKTLTIYHGRRRRS